MRQAAGFLDGPAGHPHVHLTGLHPLPQDREPVPQIQRIRRSGSSRRCRVMPEDGTELGRRELRHLRRAVPTQPHQPLTTLGGHPRPLKDSVQIRPLGRHHHQLGLHPPLRPPGTGRLRQRAVRVQLAQPRPPRETPRAPPAPAPPPRPAPDPAARRTRRHRQTRPHPTSRPARRHRPASSSDGGTGGTNDRHTAASSYGSIVSNMRSILLDSSDTFHPESRCPQRNFDPIIGPKRSPQPAEVAEDQRTRVQAVPSQWKLDAAPGQVDSDRPDVVLADSHDGFDVRRIRLRHTTSSRPNHPSG